MDITVNISDDQWHQFQDAAKETVEQKWNGKYEDFAKYIMEINIESYVSAQKRRQEKKAKQEQKLYEAALHDESLREASMQNKE